MTINTKSITVVPAQTVNLSDITITNVAYNTLNRTCDVTYNRIYHVFFRGSEYDALGQWSDETLLTAVINKLGATPKPNLIL